MRPEGWLSWDGKVKQEFAEELANSPRGFYIIGRSLFLARQELNKVEGPRRENSDIEDMEVLGEGLFQVGWVSEYGREQLSTGMCFMPASLLPGSGSARELDELIVQELPEPERRRGRKRIYFVRQATIDVLKAMPWLVDDHEKLKEAVREHLEENYGRRIISDEPDPTPDGAYGFAIITSILISIISQLIAKWLISKWEERKKKKEEEEKDKKTVISEILASF